MTPRRAACAERAAWRSAPPLRVEAGPRAAGWPAGRRCCAPATARGGQPPRPQRLRRLRRRRGGRRRRRRRRWPPACAPATWWSPPRCAGAGRHVVTCPSAPLLAGELRRAGLRVHAGRIAHRRPAWSRPGRPRAAGRRRRARRRHGVGLLLGGAGRPAVGGGPGRRRTPPAGRCCGPGVVTGGLAALRSLRAGRRRRWPRWAAATGPRQVLLAGPRSFCAGVERAIEIVERALDAARRPGLRAQADRAQHPRRGRPRAARRGLRGRARRGAGRRHGGVLRARGVARRPGRGRGARAGRHRRHLPAGGQGARRGAPVRRRRLPVALIGHAGHEEVEGTLGEAPGAMALVADVGRRRPRWSPPTRTRSPT